MRHRFWLLQLQLCILFSLTEQSGCAEKSYPGSYQLVCLCNSTYCDDFPRVETIKSGSSVIITSSKKGQRFQRNEQIFKKINKGKNEKITKITVDARKRFQEINGFGGAFTDAVGINLASLSTDTQENLLKSYFSDIGLEYSLGRVPIASTDFSTREYSYAEVPEDFNLKNFTLLEEDYLYKIKYIQKAQKLAKNGIRLVASPWSPPAWMKVTNRMAGGGPLRDDLRVHRAYANYFTRFFEEYKKNDIEFWAVTVQNEPTSGAIPNYKWQTLFFTASTEKNFVRDYLGPTMKSHDLTSSIVIICLDDDTIWLPAWADIMFEDDKVNNYVDGIGIHWYTNNIFTPNSLTKTHERHPEKFILATEACTGSNFPHGPILGNWYRAEQYAYDIITDLNNFVSGWIDWNMCLDLLGGPTWVNNVVDSPIIVNKTSDEFYKQPMFYAMGHFSKFIKPGSRRISLQLETSNKQIYSTAVVGQNGRRILVILNQSDDNEKILIEDVLIRKSGLQLFIPGHSITTIIWDKPI